MLTQIIPLSSPLFAVFADEKGNPDFKPCVCLGAVQVNDGDENTHPARVVSGYCLIEHIEAADFHANFVGYSADKYETTEWIEKCKTKRDALNKLAEKAKQSRIIVPDRPVVGAFVKPN